MASCKKETPLAVTGGALCVGLDSPSHELSTLTAQRAQFLMQSYAVPPMRAATLATIIFEGASND